MRQEIETIGDKIRISVSGSKDGVRVRKVKTLPASIGGQVALQIANLLADETFGLKQNVSLAIASAPDEPGSVYLIKNEYLPGLIKIGKSMHGARGRMRNLSTAYPVDWELVAEARVKHMSIIETVMHLHFRHERVNPNREFFRIAAEDAMAALKVCEEIDGISMAAAINSIGR